MPFHIRSSPSARSLSSYNNNDMVKKPIMRKKLLLKEEVHQSNSLQHLEAIDGDSTLDKEFENNELEHENNELEHEIECPRCYGIMTLSSSVFGNRVAYFCNECINSLNLC